MLKSPLLGGVSGKEQGEVNLPESPDPSNAMDTMGSKTSFLPAIPRST